MKIPPPGGAPPGIPPEGVKPGARPDAAPGTTFAEKLEKAQAPDKVAAAEAARASGVQAPAQTMAAHLEAVSREMAAGRIETREQAIGRLVERLLDARFGGALPPESLAQAKAQVAAQVAADPNLAERIDRLLGQKG
jgi:hypothetical protein